MIYSEGQCQSLVRYSEIVFNVLVARQRARGIYDTKEASRQSVKVTNRSWKNPRGKEFQSILKEYERLEKETKTI